MNENDVNNKDFRKIDEIFKRYRIADTDKREMKKVDKSKYSKNKYSRKISFDVVIKEKIEIYKKNITVERDENKAIINIGKNKDSNNSSKDISNIAILIEDNIDTEIIADIDSNLNIILLSNNHKNLYINAYKNINLSLFDIAGLKEVVLKALKHASISLNIIPLFRGDSSFKIKSFAIEDSSISINEALVLKDEQKFDSEIYSFLEGRDCKASINSRALLYDKSLCMLKGYVESGEKSKGSISSLSQSALLLSENAHADSIPVMAIKTNDVKASHESFIVPINNDLLFFAASRGVNEESFKRLVADGFIEPLLQKIIDEKGRNLAYNFIKEKLEDKKGV